MEARLHGLETLLLETNKMLRTLMNQGLQTSPLSSLTSVAKTARTGVTLEVDLNKDTSRPCLRRCSVLSIPTFDNALALVLGAGHAIQVSEYASAWPMVSAAANMSQALGWHRLSDGYTRETEAQRILFWLIYYFDKCLSLQLGRSSNIQEFDIIVSYPEAPVQSEYRSWHLWFLTLIDTAAARGLIYEHLFSPGSMRQSSKQRSQRVLELAARLDGIRDKSASIVDATVYRRQYMIYLLKSNAVVIGCLRTLI
jgi:hypothetical protein